MRKSILRKAIPLVLLGAVSGGSGHGMENAGGASIFNDDDLKALMASSHPLKERNIAHINQETDVITFYASTDSDEEPTVNREIPKENWTWGESIPPSKELAKEILARGAQPCIKFGIMSEAEFSGTEKPEPFTCFGKEWEPSADLIREFSIPQFQKVISGMKVTPSGDSGSTPGSNKPTVFGGDPHQ